MEDIIDIIVTETTNTIEITSQSTDEVIDVNIIDNREDVTLNVTPTVVEININSLTGNFGVAWGEITGTLASQTDLNTALGLKADLVGGKVPSSQLPSYVDDIVEVANYAALPATGETGKIYVVLDTNKIYRWSGSAYVEIIDSAAVWGAITGTLSSQTDLQNALNAKFDDPTGDTTQYIAGDGSLITFPVAGQSGTLVREVRNTTGATLTKGTIVYISGATGNKPTVSKAIATGDSTSAQTFGMCQANISNNSNGYVVCVGDLSGLDTSGLSEGAQLYLSSTTAGTYTTTKQLAPAHLVYIGIVTRAHPTLGQIEVKIQNGYELDEIHDVAISSVANNDGLFYESSTDLWKNKSIATVLGYTPQAQLNGTGFVKASGTTISYDSSTYALDSAVVHNTGNENVAGIKTFTSGLSADYLWIKEGLGFANPSGYAQLATDITYFHFNNSNNTAYARFLYGSGLRTYTLPDSNGTIALTSNLSAYLTTSAAASTYQTILTNPVTGSGGITTNYIPKYTGVNALGSSSIFEGASGYVSIGNTNQTYNLDVSGTGRFTGALTGTSATFTNSLHLDRTGVTAATPLRFTTAGSNDWFIGQSPLGTSTSDLFFYSYGTSSSVFTLAKSTGAATFSNSVAVGTNLTVGTASGGVSAPTNILMDGTYRTGGAAFDALKLYLYKSSTETYGLGLGDLGDMQYWAGTTSTGVHRFFTSQTERMRITSGGNLLVGTSFAPAGNGLGIAIYKNDYPRITFRNSTTGDQASGGFQFYLNGNDFYQESPGNTIFANGGTERMRITSGGAVQIGTRSDATESTANLALNNTNYGGFHFLDGTAYYIGQNSNFRSLRMYSGGSTGTGVNLAAGATSWGTYSDERMKTDLVDIENATEKVSQLRSMIGRYKTDEQSKKRSFLIAQDVKEVLPEAISEDLQTGMLEIRYTEIIPLLVASIKELKAELDTLKNK